MIAKLFQKIKVWLCLYDLNDIRYAFATCGNAKDRDELEWKVKQRLMEMRP